jgi:hypothetical protein
LRNPLITDYLDYMDARFEKKKAQAVDHSVAAWAQAVNTGGRNKNSRMHMAAPGFDGKDTKFHDNEFRLLPVLPQMHWKRVRPHEHSSKIKGVIVFDPVQNKRGGQGLELPAPTVTNMMI